MKALSDAHITVIGLGLSGSLARALRGRCRCLTGLDRQPGVAAWALVRGRLDRAEEQVADALAGADHRRDDER